MKLLDLILAPFIGLLSSLLPRQKNVWALLVNFHQSFEGNLRTLAHELGKNPKNTIYILNYRPQDDLSLTQLPNNVQLIRARSWAECWVRVRAGNVVFTHGIKELLGRYQFIYHVRYINVWHGIPIKGMANMDHAYARKHLRGKKIRQNARIDTFCVSSDIERTFMAACHLMDAEHIKPIGIPRTDILLREDALDASQQALERDILTAKAERKMLLYAPTFRDYDRKKIGLSRELCFELSELMQAHNMMLALRPHPRDSELFQEVATNLPNIILADSKRWNDSNIVLKHSDLLITDYSSLWIEYLLLNRPIMGYCWDLKQYTERRGLLFDFTAIFPGKITQDPDTFLAELRLACAQQLQLNQPDHHQRIRRLFHKYNDGRSSQRLIALSE